MTEYVLTMEDVTKSFVGSPAVDSLSASFPRGCIYGFLGPNGAGKTTTIRMVMDIIRPDSGQIELLGGVAPGQGKDRIGYLPEERGMYRKMKATDFLIFIGRLKGMSPSDAANSASRWLAALELDSRAGSKIEEYSRGMQQKLQFATTVINEPELLILDEPFSGLDPVNLEVVKQQMLALRASGTTIIFSTHMMEHAEKLCDRIMLINKGRKILDGTLEDIRSRGTDNVLLIETAADENEVAEMRGVQSAVRGQNTLSVTLDNDGNNREFLRSLLEKAEIRSFRVKTPSLHETFVSLVSDEGDSDAE
jgi:ABC-2 type transport system ATP-binding protein